MHLLDRIEYGPSQPRVAHGSGVVLGVGVSLRIARLDVLDPDAVLLRPCKQRANDVFRPVVRRWQASRS